MSRLGFFKNLESHKGAHCEKDKGKQADNREGGGEARSPNTGRTLGRVCPAHAFLRWLRRMESVPLNATVFRADGPDVSASRGFGKGAWAPIVDVQQCKGTLEVAAELPGLKKGEVKVELSDDSLIIEGERRREHKEGHEGSHRRERSYGRFYRSIPLPQGAKTEQLKAELSEGVPKVSVPVPESKKKRKEVMIEEKKTKPAAA